MKIIFPSLLLAVFAVQMFCPVLGQKKYNKLYPVREISYTHNGFINYKGELVVPTDYERVGKFSEGLAYVRKNKKYGYIDTTGTVVIPLHFDDAYDFKCGLAYVEKDDKRFYINRRGEKTLDHNSKLEFSEGLAAFRYYKKYGFIDTKGNLVIDTVWDKTGTFSEGKVWVKKNSSDYYYFLNKKGETLFKTIFKPITGFYDGIACVRINDKCGFIDSTGYLIIKPEFDYERWLDYKFVENVAAVQKNDYFGVINKQGEWIIQPKDKDRIYNRSEGIFRIQGYSRGYGYMDSTGNVLADLIYGRAYDFSCGRAIARFIADGEFRFVLLNKQIDTIKVFSCSEGVASEYGFDGGICLIHRSTKSGRDYGDEGINKYGGAIDTYINRNGNIIWEGKPWYVCFPPETRIGLPNGQQKPINQITTGEHILAYDTLHQVLKTTTVTDVVKHTGNYPLIEITYNIVKPTADLNSRTGFCQKKLRATPYHPVYTTTGTKRMKDLQTGDVVLFYSPEDAGGVQKCRIIAVKNQDINSTEVINLRTTAGTYFAGCVVVYMK